MSYWRMVDAVDEWAHRHNLVGASGFPSDRTYSRHEWFLRPFRWLCDHRERRVIGRQEFKRQQTPAVITTPTILFDFTAGTVTAANNINTTAGATWTWNLPTPPPVNGA
jgi:hypothetical protein